MSALSGRPVCSKQDFHAIVQFWGDASSPAELVTQAGGCIGNTADRQRVVRQIADFLSTNREFLDDSDLPSLSRLTMTLSMMPKGRGWYSLSDCVQAETTINKINKLIGLVLQTSDVRSLSSTLNDFSIPFPIQNCIARYAGLLDVGSMTIKHLATLEEEEFLVLMKRYYFSEGLLDANHEKIRELLEGVPNRYLGSLFSHCRNYFTNLSWSLWGPHRNSMNLRTRSVPEVDPDSSDDEENAEGHEIVARRGEVFKRCNSKFDVMMRLFPQGLRELDLSMEGGGNLYVLLTDIPKFFPDLKVLKLDSLAIFPDTMFLNLISNLTELSLRKSLRDGYSVEDYVRLFRSLRCLKKVDLRDNNLSREAAEVLWTHPDLKHIEFLIFPEDAYKDAVKNEGKEEE